MSKINTKLLMDKTYIWNLLQNTIRGRQINGDRDETYWPQDDSSEGE